MQQYGYVVNRYQVLDNYKLEIKKKKERTQKRFHPNKFGLKDRLNPDNNNNNNTQGDYEKINMDEMITPEWTKIYNQSNEKIKQMKQYIEQLTIKANQRIRQQFGQTDELDDEIHKLSQNVQKLLNECQNNLSKIDNIDNEENFNMRKIKQNIKQTIAIQIQEQAVSLRRQQKRLYDSLKKYDNFDHKELQQKDNNYDQDLDQMQEDNIYAQLAQERDGQINELVNTINQLSELFKQMQEVVYDQGTVLDRIDFNIQDTLHQTKKAKRNLVKAEGHQKGSGIAKYLILGLTITIVIETIILGLKWTN